MSTRGKYEGEQQKFETVLHYSSKVRCLLDDGTLEFTRACGKHQHSALCVYHLSQKLNSSFCALELGVKSQSHRISRLERI